VLNELEMSNFRKRQFALFIDTKARLGVGQAPVAIPGFIAGKSRRLSNFDAAEERLERFVYPTQDILQDLRVDNFVFWPEGFDVWQLRGLLDIGYPLATHPVSIPALLQRGVIQLCAQGKLFVQQAFLLLRRVDPILIGFLHTALFFSRGKMRKVPTSPAPNKERALHPHGFIYQKVEKAVSSTSAMSVIATLLKTKQKCPQRKHGRSQRS
jgi:hypothetical protein